MASLRQLSTSRQQGGGRRGNTTGRWTQYVSVGVGNSFPHNHGDHVDLSLTLFACLCHPLVHTGPVVVPRDAVPRKAVRCNIVPIGPCDASAPGTVVSLVATPQEAAPHLIPSQLLYLTMPLWCGAVLRDDVPEVDAICKC